MTKNKRLIHNKTNEMKFWLTIYSYFDVLMIMVIINNYDSLSRKNKYLKKSHKILNKKADYY